jgi:hypothetical protein
MANLPKDFSLKGVVTKEQALKAIQNMDYNNAMDIPKEIIPKGMEYGRADIRKPERIQGLLQKGWTFVPASRHPEMVFKAIEESDPRTSDWIMFGKDLVLMERSIELCNAERAHMDEMNRQRILTTPGLENAPYQPNIKTQSYIPFDDGKPREASFA